MRLLGGGSGGVGGGRDDVWVASLLDDIGASANWMASALGSSGYRADFSPSSLREVERFMAEHSNAGAAVDGGLLASGLGARLFGLGCYVGETIRRGLGGVWDADDADPAGEINVTLRLSDQSVIWPVQRVIKRFHNGPEGSIVAYALFLGLDLQTCNPPPGPNSPAPAGPKRRRGLFRRR
ncbi:hypothetical protein ACFV29_30935 [Streptomyces sp. NPDC059690]|uniref:hypothetical protein n=1 Tax=Streptomyces sp. NPDC059690 TaxID=3346907 RepID=UPI0036B8A2DE